MQPPTPRHATLILGPHRGGTSCVAELVYRLGHAFGRDILGPHACNLRGLWENAAVVAWNDRLLAELGSAWFDAGFIDCEDLTDEAPRYAKELAETLAAQFETTPPPRNIAIKDPRLCRLLPLYTQALTAFDYRIRRLIVLRDPRDSAASLYRRDGIPSVVGHALWISHMLGALRGDDGSPARILSYADLLDSGDALIADLARWLADPDTLRTPDIAHLRQCVDPKLSHASPRPTRSPPHPTNPLEELAAEMFDTLRQDRERETGVAPERWHEWAQRFRDRVTGSRWLDRPGIAILHHPIHAGWIEQDLLAPPRAPTTGLLILADGEETSPLPAAIADPVAAGHIGLFFNRRELGSEASLVRGIALANGRSVLLVRDPRRLSALDPGLEQARQVFSTDEPLILIAAAPGIQASASPIAEPLALYLPARIAGTLDPWRHIEQSAGAWNSLIAALDAAGHPPRLQRIGQESGKSVMMPAIEITPFPSMLSSRIDVIVPVHRGFASLRACLESLRAARTRTSFELVLIDDASPDPEIRALLRDQARQPDTTLLENPTNLGFAAAVNRAAACHPERDFVLLNSDTLVADDWLDRLVRCAESDPRIATATPFSNNASLCSYPVPMHANALPDGMDLARLDALFVRANAGQILDLPTGVGFCMFVRRAAWSALDGFDALRFGRGYGEENDFCRRAAAAGWRNVLCADLFVFHEGGASFGAERQTLMEQADLALASRHPDYDALVRGFLGRDPLQPLRRAVDVARIAEESAQIAPILAERERELDALRTDRARRDARVESEMLTLRTQVTDTAEALRHAEECVRIRERELAECASQATDYASALERTENLVQEREHELTEHIKQIAKYAAALERNENLLQERKRELGEHIKQIAEYAAALERTEHLVQERERELAASTKQIAEYAAALERAEGFVREREGEISTLNLRLDALLIEHASLRQQFDSLLSSRIRRHLRSLRKP